MRSYLRLLIVTGIVVLAGAVAAYAWDASKAKRIADGVTVGGVDIGGLEPDAADREIRAELVEPLAEPVRVEADGRVFTLSTDELNLRMPIRSILSEAEAVSRDGSLPSRVWRYVTGEEVEHEIDARISFSRRAVDAFIERIAGEVDRDAHDASIVPAIESLRIAPARAGATLDADGLREEIVAAIRAPASPPIDARVERVEAQLRASDLRTSYPTYITVDRDTFKLRLFTNLEIAKTYTIAVGQQGYETSAGLYAVQDKQVNPTWYVPEADWAGRLAGEVVPPGPDNPLKARWMGFNGAAGIHGTADIASLGSAASHGCIRMAVPDVIDLYERVDVGTPVYIE